MVDHYEGEDVIITLERNASNTVTNQEGKIKSIRISGGDENTELRHLFGGKTIFFGKPKEKFRVDFEVIISNKTSAFTQMQFGGSSLAAGTVLESSSTQDEWRIMVTYVPKSSHKTSGSVVCPPKTSDDSLQYIFVDCRAVTFERNFDAEDMFEGTLSFEFSATDSDGYANFFEHYTNSTTNTLLTIGTTTAYDKYRGQLTWNTTTPAWTGSYST